MDLASFLAKCKFVAAKAAGPAAKQGHVARHFHPVRRAVGVKRKAAIGAKSLAAKGAMLAAGAGAVTLVCTKLPMATPWADAAPAVVVPYSGPVGGFGGGAYGPAPEGAYAPSTAGFFGFPAAISAGGYGLLPAGEIAPLPRELRPILVPAPAAAPGPVPAEHGKPQDVPEPGAFGLLGVALICAVAIRFGSCAVARKGRK